MEKFSNSRIRQLYSSKTRRYGRNNSGHITVAHIGGRGNNAFKLLDLRRALNGESGMVVRIEFDANRTAFLALLYFARLGLFTYILLPEGMKIGGKVHVFGGRAKNFNYGSHIGSSLQMAHIPLSTPIHNIEGGVGGGIARGGRIARAAGTFSKIIRRVALGRYVGLSLPSGKMAFLPSSNLATIGQVSNIEHRFNSLLSAGRGVRLGRRPGVRGVAMNPVDHPHGGGEGKTSGGRPSVSKWGWLTKGGRTRNRGKSRREKLWITQLNKLV